MAANPNFNITPEEYLQIEREAEFKSEYVDGTMYAMAGGSPPHSLISGNAHNQISNQLRDTPCLVFNSDLKVRVPDSRKFFYPDVSVVCASPEYDERESGVLINPLVIIEVLSPSTAAYDRGKKFQWYQQIESLREYILIAHDEPVIEQFVRQPSGSWLYTKVEGIEQSVALATVNCNLKLKDIYAKVLT